MLITHSFLRKKNESGRSEHSTDLRDTPEKKKLYSGALHLLTCIRSVIPNRMTYLKNILPLRKLQDGVLETFTPDNQTIHRGGESIKIGISIRALNNLHFLASCALVYEHSVFDFQPNFKTENENYRKEEFMIYRPRFGFYPQFVYKRISDVTKDVKTNSFSHGVNYICRGEKLLLEIHALDAHRTRH